MAAAGRCNSYYSEYHPLTCLKKMLDIFPVKVLLLLTRNDSNFLKNVVCFYSCIFCKQKFRIR